MKEKNEDGTSKISKGLLERETKLEPATSGLGKCISINYQELRVRAKISLHSGASAGWADARRRDAGDVVHRRGAATQQMPFRRRAPQGCRLSELQFLCQFLA
jgi:hypothetical protein